MLEAEPECPQDLRGRWIAGRVARGQQGGPHLRQRKHGSESSSAREGYERSCAAVPDRQCDTERGGQHAGLQADRSESAGPRGADQQSHHGDLSGADASAAERAVDQREQRPEREGCRQDHVVVDPSLGPEPEACDHEPEQRGSMAAGDPPQEPVRTDPVGDQVQRPPETVDPDRRKGQEQQQVPRLIDLRHLRDEGCAAGDVAGPERDRSCAQPILLDPIPGERLVVLVAELGAADPKVLFPERGVCQGFGPQRLEALRGEGHDAPRRQRARTEEGQGAGERDQRGVEEFDAARPRPVVRSHRFVRRGGTGSKAGSVNG